MTVPAVTIISRGYKDKVAGPFVMKPSMSHRERARRLLGYLAGGPALAARGLVQVCRHTVAAPTRLNCRHPPTRPNYADGAVRRFGSGAGGGAPPSRASRAHPLSR